MTEFTKEQRDALTAPLDKAKVAQRDQAGRKLSYIESWWAISEANRIFGFADWDRQTVDMVLLGEPRLTGDKWRVGYRAKVKISVRTEDGGIITREGSGFGSGIDKDVDQAHESALKEAESDAMKRALMTFGNPFGLALYDKTQANVASGGANQNAAQPGKQITQNNPGVVTAMKAAIDMCDSEPALDAWKDDNKVSFDRLSEDDYREVVAYWREAVRKARAARQSAAA